MHRDKIFYYLALQAISGLGPVSAKKLVKHFGGAKNVLLEQPRNLKSINGIGSFRLRQLKNPDIFKRAEREIRFLESKNIGAICFDEDTYPARLKHCPDAPLVLFKKGSFHLDQKKIISIVGTRMMTSYGHGFLREFIQNIRKFDPVIISGLAYGVDICAHQEALRNGISTIGVLAHGLDRVYPRRHADTAARMLEQGGLFSEFWSGTSPERENFVKRNRIIAGISEATIVVESANKGGSLITADLAGSYNRDVFAVPGRKGDKFSEGCNMLIKSNKAALLTSVKDLEYVLGWESNSSETSSSQQKVLAQLNDDERALYKRLMGSKRTLLDQLALESGLSIQKSLALLLQLELKGMVRSLPGKWYEAIQV